MNYKDDDTVKGINTGVWKKIFKIILRLKKKIILLVIFAVVLAFLESSVNFLNAFAIETYVENKDYSTLTIYIVGNIIFAFGFGFLVWAFIKTGSIIEAEVNYNIRKEAFKNLQRLSFSYFDNTPQGWIMARMTSDARRLANIISWSVLDFFWSILFMIFTMIILFIYSVKLALIVLASIPVMFLIAIVFRKKILNNYRESRKHNSQATAKYSEAFLGAKTTKSLVIEEANLLEFDNVTRDLRKSSIRAVSTSALFSALLSIATYIALALVMKTGSDEVLNNALTISTLFLFIRATTGFFDPIMQLTNILSNVQQAQASAERIVELIEAKPDIVDTDVVIEKYGNVFSPKKELFKSLEGNIKFDDVTFYYKENEIVLDSFNLEIQKGQTVAFVGHTGSGKTTIVNLLSRFYEPKKGKILIDNIDYKDISISYLHSQIGYVLQSPHLFSTTIRENIKYGKLDATDEEIKEAARIVGADKFILELENGYDTTVGEGGNLLSLGQKQLISFARAIISDPKILILDEATSSIDSGAEKELQVATKNLLKGRTSVIVAHRLSTIVDSDLIVLLDMGKIVEKGTHLELLNKRGLYFELYKNQFMRENSEKAIKSMGN